STSEKLEIIPEGELKQKPQATNTQNRTSGKVTSPPPTSSSSSVLVSRVFVFDRCELSGFRFLVAFDFADNERDCGIDRFC
ncbi:unnamed protein product, partial [Rotaria sp. Silwood1]